LQSDNNLPWRSGEPSDNPLEQSVGETSYPGEGTSFCSQCGWHWGTGQNFCPECGHFSAGTGAPELGAPADCAGQRMGAVTWGGWQISAGISVVMISLFAAAAAAFAIGSLYPEQQDAIATWISVHLMGLAIVATVWYLGLRHSRDPLAVLRLSGVQWPRKRTILLMIGVLAASLIATSIYSGIVEWLDLDQFATPDVESDIFFDGPAVLLTFQALAFITPISEELFFRGFIFRGLLPKMGPWGAIAASALVFSAFHLSLGVLVPIFITGFLLAWLYWRTGSLWAAIGAHAGQNALALGMQALAG